MPIFDPSLLAKGGPMMAALLLLALGGLVLFVERALYLHRSQIRPKAFLDGIENILAKRRLVEALTVCEETPGPVASVVKAALLHAEEDEAGLRFHVQEAAIAELPPLERRLELLAALAQIAPLVGLLGTVSGMTTAFLAFQRDYATAAALASGMWQALLSTAGGLLLAIPAHFGHRFLVGRVHSIVGDMEWAANEAMRYLLMDYRGRGPAAAEGPR